MQQEKGEDRTIYTFNNSGYIGNSVIKDYLHISDDAMYQMIWKEVNVLHRRLKMKNIAYQELKGALVPNQDKDKYETCFVIDTEQVPSSSYGFYIFEHLIPLLDKKSTYSILHGDYIPIVDDGSKNMQMMLKKVLEENLCRYNNSFYQHCGQYYLIYINRLSKNQRDMIVEALKGYDWFTGYVDTTYSSLFKLLISDILPQLVIKYKGQVIGPHMEDCDDDKNVNMTGYPFEENGFQYVSINESSYAPFLSYKIEGGYAEQEDVGFSLNALFPKFDSLAKISLQVQDEKWEKYLMDKEKGKGVIMETLGFGDGDKERFIKIVYNKICQNYLYNLRQNEYGALLCNVCVEMKTVNENIRKTMVALKYIPDSGEVQVVTIT